MDILFLSHTFKGSEFVVGSHHLSREVASMGHRVAHVSTPLSYAHFISNKGAPRRVEQAQRGVFTDDDGVVNFVPKTVLPSDIYWTDTQYMKLLGRIGFIKPDIIFVDQPALFTKAQTESTLIFRPTDVFTRPSLIRRASMINDLADALVATSEPVRSEFTKGSLRPEVVVPNGVQLENFLDAKLVPFRQGAVYVGAVDERFDVEAVKKLALSFPDMPVDIYGPESIQIDKSSLPSNLSFKGAADYWDLPNILRQYRIGLLPFNNHPLNVGRGPMKLYEYLAAGLYVLRSSVNEGSAHAPGVHVYRSFSDIPRCATAIMESPTENVEGMIEARRHSWSQKARDVLDFAAALQR